MLQEHAVEHGEDDLLLRLWQAAHALELALELRRGPALPRGFARVRAGDAEEHVGGYGEERSIWRPCVSCASNPHSTLGGPKTGFNVADFLSPGTYRLRACAVEMLCIQPWIARGRSSLATPREYTHPALLAPPVSVC